MSPRPRQTDMRRRQILEAAAEVIVDHGLADTRVADIAHTVGVSPGHHRQSASAPSSRRAARGPMRTVDGDYALWIEAWSRARHDETVDDARNRMDAHWRKAIADVVADGQRAGQFDPATDPEAFALKITALIDGLQVVLGEEKVGPDEMLHICLEVASHDLDHDFTA